MDSFTLAHLNLESVVIRRAPRHRFPVCIVHDLGTQVSVGEPGVFNKLRGDNLLGLLAGADSHHHIVCAEEGNWQSPPMVTSFISTRDGDGAQAHSRRRGRRRRKMISTFAHLKQKLPSTMHPSIGHTIFCSFPPSRLLRCQFVPRGFVTL